MILTLFSSLEMVDQSNQSRMILPIQIGSQPVNLETDVVEMDIPLLTTIERRNEEITHCH